MQKTIGADLMPGRESRGGERWSQEDVMTNVRVKNPEKKVILRQLPQGTRDTEGQTIYAPE